MIDKGFQWHRLFPGARLRRRPRPGALARAGLAAGLAAALALAAFAGAEMTMAQDRPAPAQGGETAAPAAAALPELELDDRVIPLGGALKNPELWAAFKARFVTDQGRVVDTANGMISHSEGQGYGMLLAVAANDREAFERIWGWSRANLMVRDDKLQAWRWDPDKRPGVGDMNNATDGDILTAWALAEAGEYWNNEAYKVEARRIAVEVGRKTVLFKTRWGALLLPSVYGFGAEQRPDGPVVNVSYWVFPAFPRLYLVAPEIDWKGVSRTGMELLAKSRFGAAQLPTEWISARSSTLKPAEGFPQNFGYNAIRIPLYMAWAGLGGRSDYEPYVRMWSGRRAAGVVDTRTGVTQAMGESGYDAIAALTLCAVNGERVPADFLQPRAHENYYPAILHLLSVVAVQMRYPQCLGENRR
ncbi:glycosyl hydrolase family 8 [Camelimonas abortus]|uniref:cellulase n=1 Tax=Camelimonas abortus TaxID=1017184 RepID=A0ABV7LEG6_9HYPH